MHGNGSTTAVGGRKGRMGSRSLLATIAFLALTLAASCGGTSGEGGGQQPAASGAPDAPAKEDQALGREPLGDADAPVVLTEYADYQ